MKIKIFNTSKFPNPEYQHEGDAGCDLMADIESPVTIPAHGSMAILTGIHIQLPEGYEAQVRGRSGLNFKYDIIVPVGTIDSNFTGNIGVKLYNLSDVDFTVNPGERIAQLIISKVETAEWKNVDVLLNTNRGENGFGSTGTK